MKTLWSSSAVKVKSFATEPLSEVSISTLSEISCRKALFRLKLQIFTIASANDVISDALLLRAGVHKHQIVESTMGAVRSTDPSLHKRKSDPKF